MSGFSLKRRSFLAAAGAFAAAAALPRLSRAQTAPNQFLLESARLARGSMIHRLDASLGYEPYFELNIASDPPEGMHSSWDFVDTAGRFVAAMIALRKMGLPVDLDAENGLRAFFLANQGADGLFYDQPSPWSGEYAETFAQSRAMLALTEWFLATGDRRIQERIERMIAAVELLLEPAGDGAVFPGKQYLRGWLDRSISTAAEDGIPKPGYGALMAGPLLKYAAVTGSKPARKLAGVLLEGFLANATVERDGTYLGHTHSWGILPTAVALVDYALLTGRDDIMRLAIGMFEFTVQQGTPWGWVPDGIGFAPGYIGANYCETCGLADLIHLGLSLARQGYTPAWGAVERITRNQLIANQFKDIDSVIPPDQALHSQTNAAAILRGSFEAWAKPNSLLGGLDLLDHGGLEACCTGSAILALSAVQNAVVQQRGGIVWIDLPFSAVSPSAIVESHEPANGRLVVTLNMAAPLAVRLPEGTAADAIRVAVNGADVPVRTETGVIHLSRMPSGTVIDIRYPLAERTETREVAGLTLTASWRGNTLITLDPPGDRYPIYQPGSLLLPA